MGLRKVGGRLPWWWAGGNGICGQGGEEFTGSSSVKWRGTGAGLLCLSLIVYVWNICIQLSRSQNS